MAFSFNSFMKKVSAEKASGIYHVEAETSFEVKVNKFSFGWTVSNLNLLNQSSHRSPLFHAQDAKVKWALNLTLRSDCVIVDLILVESEEKNYSVKYELFAYNSKKELIKSLVRQADINRASVTPLDCLSFRKEEVNNNNSEHNLRLVCKMEVSSVEAIEKYDTSGAKSTPAVQNPSTVQSTAAALAVQSNVITQDKPAVSSPSIFQQVPVVSNPSIFQQVPAASNPSIFQQPVVPSPPAVQQVSASSPPISLQPDIPTPSAVQQVSAVSTVKEVPVAPSPSTQQVSVASIVQQTSAISLSPVEPKVVTFSAHGTLFEADRATVASNCPLLINSKEEPIKTNMKPEIFKHFLNFVLTKEANVAEFAAELLPQSDYYELQELKNLCEEALIRSLTKENCFELIILSDLHSTPKLKNETTRFIAANASYFSDKPEWNKLKSTHKSLFDQIVLSIINCM